MKISTCFSACVLLFSISMTVLLKPSKPSVDFETPSIRAVRQNFKKEIVDFDYLIDYQPDTFLEHSYEFFKHLCRRLGIDFSLVPWVTIAATPALISKMQVNSDFLKAISYVGLYTTFIHIFDHLYKHSNLPTYDQSSTLKSALKRLAAAEDMLTYSCIHSGLDTCTGQEKELLLKEKPASMMGQAWFYFAVALQAVGIAPALNALQSCISFYLLHNMYVAGQQIPLQAYSYFLMNLLSNHLFSEKSLFLMGIDRYDEGGFLLEMARLNLLKAKRQFNTILWKKPIYDNTTVSSATGAL